MYVAFSSLWSPLAYKVQLLINKKHLTRDKNYRYQSMHNLIISTDLDGTLLDHDNYDPTLAGELLKTLEQLGIPIIFNTSKTFSEVLEIREQLGNCHPFICENGSAIFIPANHPLSENEGDICPDNDDYFMFLLGFNRSTIIETLSQYKSRYGFRGFSDFSITELMSLTGLSARQAVSSTKRGFSEPLLWPEDDSNIEQFRREMENHFMKVVRGGRFTHVIGMTDKGKAQAWVRTAYETFYNRRYEVMALGDAENDLDMILRSDYPVQIRSLQHEFPSIPEDINVYRTSAIGPAGWHEAVTRQLQNMGLLGS